MNPTPPELVRVESIAVVPISQFISTMKVAEDMLIHKHMSWLRALYVLAEFGIDKSKIRVCHID